MLIETIIILFVAAFVTIVAYGHILLLKAVLAPKAGGTRVKSQDQAPQIEF